VPCPNARCGAGDTGPGQSIHGANSHPDVVTVAAVTVTDRRLGYSSQGPGGLDSRKPDLAGLSQFAGSGIYEADSGTSAASPVAAELRIDRDWPVVGVELDARVPEQDANRRHVDALTGALDLYDVALCRCHSGQERVRDSPRGSKWPFAWRDAPAHPVAGMRLLDQQTILVTGATDGLGRALAQDLAARGATVLLHGRSPDRLARPTPESRHATRSDGV